ncbi:CDP-diacylglycerol--serine O-phosphatidyltransferase [Thioclava sp. GXIMD4216]|uniref:CDP-diacylglycerol--serine O-phosphatidyltransferase n=1 Tax=Thioclava litoralis TaxID=3076557 RepID=A0ABZ1E0D0_9RHOB|nr:CDP-diacylglycerol--serine O-phosphatidyltransferase [Thioclava sp. FTW29]
MAEREDRLPFLQLIPNLVTISGMCLGLTSIRFTMTGKFETAVILIVLSAVIDGMDGLLARRLRATSEFGAELDSLSDFLCFGVAPALLVYQFALGETNSLGWVFVLAFAGAGCLRLARFNVMRSEPDSMRHFTGVPAPAGAGLCLMPVFITLSGIADARQAPIMVAIWVGIVGLLMISRIKTISPKAMRIPKGLTIFLFMAMVVMMGMIFTRFWLLMVICGCIYVALLVPPIFREKGRLF